MLILPESHVVIQLVPALLSTLVGVESLQTHLLLYPSGVPSVPHAFGSLTLVVVRSLLHLFAVVYDSTSPLQLDAHYVVAVFEVHVAKQILLSSFTYFAVLDGLQ
jgi:hypothetical protein